MRQLKLIIFTFAVLGGILFGSSAARAQSGYGLTVFDYDVAASRVVGTSATVLDYNVFGYYYNAAVEGYLIRYTDHTLQNYEILSSGAVAHDYSAVVVTQSQIQRGQIYAVFSHHFVQTIGYVGGYYYDPYGLSYNNFRDGSVPSYGFQIYQPAYLYYQWIHVATTGVIAWLPNITQLAPEGGQLGTSPIVRIVGKYIGEHSGVVPNIVVSGSGVTAQVYSIVPDGLDVVFQVAEDADVGNRDVRVVSGGLPSNTLPFRVGDRTPVITNIAPSVVDAGTTVTINVSGRDFGANPKLDIDGTDITTVVNSMGNTNINATVSVGASSQGIRNVRVTSRGRLGGGFTSPTPGASPVSNPYPIEILAKKPTIDIAEIGSIESGATRAANLQVKDTFGNPFTADLVIQTDSGEQGAAVFASNNSTQLQLQITGDGTKPVEIKGTTASSKKNTLKLTVTYVSRTDSRKFTVSTVAFEKESECSGYDDRDIGPFPGNFLLVPQVGSNKVKAKIAPDGASGDFNLLSPNPNLTVAQGRITSDSSQVVTITSTAALAKGDYNINAVPNVSGATAASTLVALVRPRIKKKIVIHAISEENDDVQRIPKGDGEPGTPNPVCVTSGANKFLDTVIAAGSDDVEMVDPTTTHNIIVAGANGKCDTEANNNDVTASTPPDPAGLQTYLDGIWGRQANIFSTVDLTINQKKVNFDLDRNGKLQFPTVNMNEWNAVVNAISVPDKINLYYLGVEFDLDPNGGAALAISERGGNIGVYSKLGLGNYVASHEIGHNLGARDRYDADSLRDRDVMYGAALAGPNAPCRVRRADLYWVQP